MYMSHIHVYGYGTIAVRDKGVNTFPPGITSKINTTAWQVKFEMTRFYCGL